MMMSSSPSEMGISPVLLQAITQTLSTNSIKKEKHSTETQQHTSESDDPQQVRI